MKKWCINIREKKATGSATGWETRSITCLYNKWLMECFFLYIEVWKRNNSHCHLMVCSKVSHVHLYLVSQYLLHQKPWPEAMDSSQSTRDEVPAALVTLNSLPAWCRPQQQGQGLSSHPLSWTSAPIRWLLHRNQVVLVALGGDLSAKTCSEEPRAGGSGMSFQAGMPHIPLKKSEETWGMKRQYSCWVRHYFLYSYYPSLSQYLKSWKLIEF